MPSRSYNNVVIHQFDTLFICKIQPLQYRLHFIKLLLLFIPVFHVVAMSSDNLLTHLVFDIDDTLYPVTNGFTIHRNQDVACAYMIEKCGFKDLPAARAFRNEYFEKYHSTVKALTVASEEGALPKNEDGSDRKFDAADLANYWVEGCKFKEHIEVNPLLIEAIKSLKEVRR